MGLRVCVSRASGNTVARVRRATPDHGAEVIVGLSVKRRQRYRLAKATDRPQLAIVLDLLRQKFVKQVDRPQRLAQMQY